MDLSPLAPDILFNLGPVPISRPVVTTWAIMAGMTLLCWLGLRRAQVHAGPLQTVLEVIVTTLDEQIAAIIHRDHGKYVPLLGTLFLFVVIANLSAIVPGVKPPTGHLETPMALAAIVFVSAHVMGIQARGLGAYASRYTKPSILLLPLNVLSEITRTFSLMVRLYGNIMSHEMVIAIVLFLAGLFLPVPFMLLGILIGIIQAYIFTVLAAVFIGAAVSTEEIG